MQKFVTLSHKIFESDGSVVTTKTSVKKKASKSKTKRKK
jgi:hypothetical protein